MTRKRTRRPGAPGAGELQRFKAQFFRALAHPTRIRLLEVLVRGGHTVQQLQQELALDQPVVSQQLAVLRNQGIVSTQKEGLAVRYALRDPLVSELLDVARRIFNNRLGETRGLLAAARAAARSAAVRAGGGARQPATSISSSAFCACRRFSA
jgi:ArsR family transcriptional regulator